MKSAKENVGGIKMGKCYFDEGHCTALKQKECENCGFYKTKGEILTSRYKAYKRLKSLDWATRRRIADKYDVGGII